MPGNGSGRSTQTGRSIAAVRPRARKTTRGNTPRSKTSQTTRPAKAAKSGPVPGIGARAGAMLNYDVVAIWSRPRKGFDPGPLLDRHFDFMVDLEKRGLLLMSGPLITRDGRFGLYGLTVLNVPTIAAAEKIWAREPFLRAGQRDADYYIWRLMEGRLPVTLDLSDQRLALTRPPGRGKA